MLRIRPNLKLPAIPLSPRGRIAVVTVVVGFALLGILSRYLRRRKTTRSKADRYQYSFRRSPGNWKVANGDIMPPRLSLSPLPPRSFHKQASLSLASDAVSVASTSTSTVVRNSPGVASLTPQQLGMMGMEALETAISYWEDALKAYVPEGSQGPPALTDEGENKFTHLLEKILDEACRLQDQCSHLFLCDSYEVFQSGSTPLDRGYDVERHAMRSMSSADSFVSAQAEVANVSELDEFFDTAVDLKQLAFYQEGVKHCEEGPIPYKHLRTQMLSCSSDMDYLAKLHCVRLAFQYLVHKEESKEWFTKVAGQLLTDIMLFGSKDPKDCVAAYDDMVEFVQVSSNWPKIEDELRGRGLKCMSFYDIVWDFLILEAFEDLEDPPSSVLAIVQNRWLSVSFKETALATAVWSVLRAKRRFLRHPDGFISHFYSIADHLMPVLAWGFLGPDEELKHVCFGFKDEVMGFLRDIFSIHTVRYTALEDLANDIWDAAKSRFDQISQRLMVIT